MLDLVALVAVGALAGAVAVDEVGEVGVGVTLEL